MTARIGKPEPYRKDYGPTGCAKPLAFAALIVLSVFAAVRGGAR